MFHLSEKKLCNYILFGIIILLLILIFKHSSQEGYQRGSPLSYIPPQKAFDLTRKRLYSDEKLASLAKKYAPMCMLHPDEKYFPVNVEWWFNKTTPVNYPENGENKIWLDVAPSNRDYLLKNPEGILKEFKGSGVPVASSYPSGKEIKEESQCHVLVMPDGGVVLVYFFIFAYNYGKSVCVGLDIGSEEEEFRYGLWDDIRGAFVSAGNVIADTGKKVGTGIVDVGKKVGTGIVDVGKKVGAGVVDVGKKTYEKVVKPVYQTVIKPGVDLAKQGLRVITGSDCIGKRYRFGNHIGDIEGCAVYLDKDLKPYQLYFGAHEFNFLERWDSPKITKVNDEGFIDDIHPENNTHPMVMMAWGSHGTWLAPGNNDYSPIALKALDTVSFAGRLVDVTPSVTIPRVSAKISGAVQPRVSGIPWMTWKTLRVVYPREWSGEVGMKSSLEKKGITNYITQVKRFGGLPVNPDNVESAIGEKRLENGPPGMIGKYGDYVPWRKSLLNEGEM